MLPGSSRPANRLAQKPLSGLTPPAHRYSRFVHQLSDFPHVQHLRAQLRASPPRYYVAPVSLHPPAASQRWVSGYRRHASPPVTPRSAPVVSDRCSYNGPAPVATETSFSVDVTGASGSTHRLRIESRAFYVKRERKTRFICLLLFFCI